MGWKRWDGGNGVGDNGMGVMGWNVGLGREELGWG